MAEIPGKAESRTLKTACFFFFQGEVKDKGAAVYSGHISSGQ